MIGKKSDAHDSKESFRFAKLTQKCVFYVPGTRKGGGILQKPTFHLGQMVLEKLIYFKQAKETLWLPDLHV